MLSNLFFITILSSLIFTHSHSQCLDNQKSSLLKLKNELIFNSSISTKLVQWNQTDDCCKWHGVECDGAGTVISLQLDDEAISGGIGDSSTLFRLEYLKKLNLANNSFNYAPIPRGIHNLTYLTHLNLSNAAFGEQVPLEISSLKSLISLDISDNPVTLDSPNLETLVRNLTRLTELYLDGIFLSSHESVKWSHIISSYLPHLKALSLRRSSLSGPLATSFWKLQSLSVLRLDSNDLSETVPHSLSGFSNLTSLSLFACNLKGSFPSKVFQIPTLQNLDLSYNFHLSGSIPPFPRNGSLESLKVRMTSFSGSIPSSIGNLNSLSELDLSSCNFSGSIPSTFAGLTRLVYVNLRNNMLSGSLPSTMFEGLSNLVNLDLGNNSFTGNIPPSLFHLPSLERLWLVDNKFSGKVEEFSIVKNVSKIVTLDLSRNRLEGPIPNSFFQLQSLKSLVLLRNLFNGTFQLDKIRSLPNLTSLYLSYNNLSIEYNNENSSLNHLSKIEELGLAACNLYDFPDFIRHSGMRILDLSKNRISGEIPSWIWGRQLESFNLSFNLVTNLQKPYYIPPSLQLLDLHSNRLEGELNLLIPPNTSLDLNYLLLASNNFTGSIPTSLCNANNLDFLDLSVNKLSGSIPSCLLENIQVVDLGKNSINGSIPNNFSTDCYLRYLNLNNNTLEGKIPESLERCEQMEFMNVGNNIINDTFPCMLSSSLRVLVLSSNRFHGEVRCHNSSWPLLQIIDISSNNFSGSLESVNFSSWRAMVLRSELGRNELSYYSLWSFGVTLTIKGLEGELVKIWPEFTTLDFSSNSFTGEIPNAIGDLSSLRLLNVSNNAMNGSIPKSFGKLRRLESLDLSRNRLSGRIPPELERLTFLSFLNLSYNNLIGEIPNGPQLQTFSADSFGGNPGLCGFNLNVSCRVRTDDENDYEKEEEEKREIEWKYVGAALGYVVGLGSIVLLLVFSRKLREKYFEKVDDVVEEILDAGNLMRIYARRVVRRQ